MNKIAKATVENHLFVKRNNVWKARDKAISEGMDAAYIQLWDDMGHLYDILLKEMENMSE